MASSTSSRWQSACFALLMLIGNLPLGLGSEWEKDEAFTGGEQRVAEVSAATSSGNTVGLTVTSNQRVTVALPCFAFVLVDVGHVPSLRFEGKFESLSGAHDQRNRIQLMDRILLQI